MSYKGITDKEYNIRSFVRFLFRFCLIGLIVGSCTQSISWLGEMANDSASKNGYPHYGNRRYYNSTEDSDYAPEITNTDSNEYYGY